MEFDILISSYQSKMLLLSPFIKHNHCRSTISP